MKLKLELETEPNLTSYGLNQRSIESKNLGIDPALVSADAFHLSCIISYILKAAIYMYKCIHVSHNVMLNTVN